MNEPANATAEPKKSNLRIYLTILFIILGVVGCIQLNQFIVRLPEGVNTYMHKQAEYAVDLAQERFDITLDYSPESVEQVEQIQAQIREKYEQKPADADISFQAYFIWGAYIGEVIKKLKGGTWHEDPETHRITLRYMDQDEEMVIEPTFWCYRRIGKGRPEDNVWYKFLLMTVGPDPSQLKTPPPQQGVPGQ
jgi:hypothetical protein